MTPTEMQQLWKEVQAAQGTRDSVSDLATKSLITGVNTNGFPAGVSLESLAGQQGAQMAAALVAPPGTLALMNGLPEGLVSSGTGHAVILPWHVVLHI